MHGHGHTRTGRTRYHDFTPSLNLRVWVDPMDPGQKCATATRESGTGTVKVTLAYTADKTQMVLTRVIQRLLSR